MVVEAAVAAVLVEEMWWRQLDSIVSAVSFGLMSMFLAIAILEHFLRPLAHTLEHAPPRGIRHRLLLFLSRGGAAMPFHGVPHQLSEVHKKRTLYHPELPSASRHFVCYSSIGHAFGPKKRVVLNNPNVQIEDTTRFSIGMFEVARAFTNFALDTTENTKVVAGRGAMPIFLSVIVLKSIATRPAVDRKEQASNTSGLPLKIVTWQVYRALVPRPRRLPSMVLLLVVVFGSQSTDRTEPLFDGADDTMAIFLALRSPKLEVLGLTTTFGNVHTALATRNALHLKATKLRIASFVHGSDGLRIASFVHGSDGHCGSRLMPPMLGQKQASMLNIVTGSHIWVEDKDLSWVDGEVFRIDGQNAHVRTTKGKAARGYLY
ncbi:putative uridine nucleosidase 2 [Zea mays]|uniref:Putative uridine nucleosidase 2 n=1 Tax=Zea mays TaxID=4577 RepID=A0A3L6F308_MAIZE|nr:putative uridine nucleosidase 2 [Zea mays]